MQQQAYPLAYPYMWNVPQWAPTTSMALFMPGLHAAPLQYAGQQRPDEPGVVGSQVRHPTALALSSLAAAGLQGQYMLVRDSWLCMSHAGFTDVDPARLLLILDMGNWMSSVCLLLYTCLQLLLSSCSFYFSSSGMMCVIATPVRGLSLFAFQRGFIGQPGPDATSARCFTWAIQPELGKFSTVHLNAGLLPARTADGAAAGNPGADAVSAGRHARAAGAPGRSGRRGSRCGDVIPIQHLQYHDAAALHHTPR